MGYLYDGGLKDIGPEVKFRLAANENCYGCSAGAAEALRFENWRVAIYPDRVCRSLRKKIADHYNVDADSILIGPGSWSLLNLIAQTLRGDSATASFAKYSFAGFRFMTNLYNYEIAELHEASFTDRQTLEFWRLARNSDIVFIANPCNPTGVYIEPSLIQALLEETNSHQIIIVDEAYIEYYSTSQDASVLSLAAKFKNLIVVRTFSKIYGLAGARIGWVHCDPEMIRRMENRMTPYATSAPALAAASEAISDGDFIEDCAKQNSKERQRISKFLHSRGFFSSPSNTNFISVDVSKHPNALERFRERGLLYRSLSIYHLAGWVRMTIGTKEANDIATDVFDDFLNSE